MGIGSSGPPGIIIEGGSARLRRAVAESAKKNQTMSS